MFRYFFKHTGTIVFMKYFTSCKLYYIFLPSLFIFLNKSIKQVLISNKNDLVIAIVKYCQYILHIYIDMVEYSKDITGIKANNNSQI